MNIKYQIVFSITVDVKKALHELLESAFDIYITEDSKVDNWFIINYYQEIPDVDVLVGVTFYLDRFSVDPDQSLPLLKQAIAESSDIKAYFKFEDAVLYTKLKKYYDEIQVIEDKIREALTYILIDKHKSNYYDLIKEVKVDVKYFSSGRRTDNNQYYNANDVKKNLEKRTAYLKEQHENQLHYLNFGQYAEFSRIKDFNSDELLQLIITANDFDELKEKVGSRGIVTPHNLSFLKDIKSNVNNIEHVRNCVAHNLEPTEEEEREYQTSISQLNEQLDNYFEFMTLNSVKSRVTHELQRLLNSATYRPRKKVVEFPKEVVEKYKLKPKGYDDITDLIHDLELIVEEIMPQTELFSEEYPEAEKLSVPWVKEIVKAYSEQLLNIGMSIEEHYSND